MDVLANVRVVLDTEAIAAGREAMGRVLRGCTEPFDEVTAIRQELANAWFCQSIVAVNEPEAQCMRDLGLSDVHVLGHWRDLALTPRPFKDREGLLFVGALPAQEVPNYDGLCWFVDEVLPLIERELGYETLLTVVGPVGKGVDLARFGNHSRNHAVRRTDRHVLTLQFASRVRGTKPRLTACRSSQPTSCECSLGGRMARTSCRAGLRSRGVCQLRRGFVSL